MNDSRAEGPNKKTFDTKETIYSKYRPSYPDSVLAYMIAENIITAGSHVADVGSGTGIFSMQMQPFVEKIFAVEPNDDMRRQAEAAFRKCSNVVSVNGFAENTRLPSNAVDCITVAQAFHWFDRAAFRRECKRILKPDGIIVLLWNVRDDHNTIIQRNAQINASFCDEYTGFSNGMKFDDTQQFDEFFTGGYAIKKFENTMQYDLETFVGRNISSSFAPLKGSIKFEPYVTALKELFQEFCSEGTIDYPYIVLCCIGQI